MFSLKFLKFAFLLIICCSFQNHLTDAQVWDSAIVADPENDETNYVFESTDLPSSPKDEELTSSEPVSTDPPGSSKDEEELTSSGPKFSDPSLTSQEGKPPITSISTDTLPQTTMLVTGITTATPSLNTSLTSQEGKPPITSISTDTLPQTTMLVTGITTATPSLNTSLTSQGSTPTTNISTTALPQTTMLITDTTTVAPNYQVYFSVIFNISASDQQNTTEFIRQSLKEGIQKIWQNYTVSKVLVTFPSISPTFIYMDLTDGSAQPEPVATIPLNATVAVQINPDNVPKDKNSYDLMLNALNSELDDYFRQLNQTSFQYDKNSFSRPEYKDDKDDNNDNNDKKSGDPLLGLWIALGVIGGLLLVAAVMLVILRSRRRRRNRIDVTRYDQGEGIHLAHTNKRK